MKLLHLKKMSTWIFSDPCVIQRREQRRSWESQIDQVEGMKTGNPLSSPFPIRSSACSLGSDALTAVSSPRERAWRSACLPPPRWTWRTKMSFVKQHARLHKHCLHKHCCTSIVCTSMLWTRERSPRSQLKNKGWLCSSPPYDLTVPVPLIWWTGWRWACPISTCIAQM